MTNSQSKRDRRWYNFIQRLIKEARDVLHPVGYDWDAGEVRHSHSKDGIAKVTIEIYLTGEGDILAWVVEKSAKIEPSRDAKTIVNTIFGIEGIDENDS